MRQVLSFDSLGHQIKKWSSDSNSLLLKTKFLACLTLGSIVKFRDHSQENLKARLHLILIEFFSVVV